MTASVTYPDVTDPRGGYPDYRAGRGGWRWIEHALDALAVVALAAVLLYLASRDGGVGMSSWHLGGVVALSLLPAGRELLRAPITVQTIVAAWSLGAVAALLFAADRADFVGVTLVYALMPMVGLSTMRLLHRRWGRLLLLGLLVLSFTLYWHRSFMQWWGYTMGELDTRWLPLSWHNQSATLMGAFGVFFFGVAATSWRVLSAGAAVIASMGLAGAWLAGSRGALVAVTLGLLAAIWLGACWQGWRRAVVTTTVVLLGAVAITGGLLAMDDDAARVTSEQSATSNLAARWHHMEAAGGMFLSRPLTGYGLGSYGTSARPHTDPGSNLTISPHNELLEPFAEGGLPFGLAVLAGGVLAGWLALRLLIDPSPPAGHGRSVRAQLEATTVAAGASATVVLLSHALVDFDWRYPVLAALAPIVLALTWSPSGPDRVDSDHTRSGRPRRSPWLGGVGVVAMTALLAVGLVGAWSARPSAGDSRVSAAELAVAHPVWDARGNAQAAVRLLRNGDVQAAGTAIERTRPWNPGWSELEGLSRIVDVERGDRDPRTLGGAFPPYPTAHTLRNLAAELLLQREQPNEELIADLLDESLALHHDYQGWGVARALARTWELRIELAARTGGCRLASTVASTAGADPVFSHDQNAPGHFRAYADDVCDGGDT